MKTLIRQTLWLTLMILGSVTGRSAVLTYSNFTGADPDSSETKATFGSNSGALAIGFTVNQAYYSLSSFSIDLAATTGASTTARFRLYANAPGGAALTTQSFTLTTAKDVASLVTFTGYSVALTMGTTYWLVVDTTSGSAATLSAAGNQLPTGTANLSYAGYRVYNETLTSFTGGTVMTDAPNFAITVPEPREYTLVAGIGLVIFALYRKRRAA